MKTYKHKLVKIEDLKPYEKNSRTHSTEQIKQIMDSIEEFGFTNPLLIDEEFNLIAGHGRLEAVKELNKVAFKNDPIKTLPCIVVEGLNEIQRRALVIADNKIAENSDWDMELLKAEIKEIEGASFDISLLGFSSSELLDLLGEFEGGGLGGEFGDGADSPYSQKIVTPIYEIKGEKPHLKDCVNDSVVKEKIKMIESAEIPSEVKDFLRKTAYRFMDFNFANFAEYYAHSPKEIQEVMENLALVIVDCNKAIEEGYIKLTEFIGGGDTDNDD